MRLLGRSIATFGRVALLVCAALARADQRAIEVAVRLPQDSRFQSTTLTFRPVDDRDVAPVTADVLPNALSPQIRLSDGAWSVDVESEAFWHERQYLVVPAERKIVVELSAKTVANAPMKVAGTATSPTKLEMVLSPLNGDRDRVAKCTATEGVMRCSVPTGIYDVRVRTLGFHGPLLDAVKFDASGPTQLPEMLFKAGSAVVGQVSVPRDVDPAGVTISARRAGSVDAHVVRPRARGRFQISGIPPGSYVLKAEHPAGFSSEAVSIEVREGAEFILPDALELRRPRRITARITPSRGPSQEQWNISLFRILGEDIETTVASSLSNEVGEWTSPTLTPGEYRLSIGATSSEALFTDRMFVETDDIFLPITLQLRRLHGLVRLGTQPVAGTLVFSAYSGRRIQTSSDANGTFIVDVPKGNSEEWTVEVDANAGTVRGTAQVLITDDQEKLTIDLPATEIRGRVVDITGQGIAGAEVVLIGDSWRTQSPPKSGDDGAFRISGLEAGNYTLFADAAELGQSEPANVEVDEVTLPVTLTIRPKRTISGTIVSPFGPVIGADVTVWPQGTRLARMPHTVSREGGDFRIELPAQSSEADLIVAPPGLVFTVLRVRLTDDPIRIMLPSQGGTLRIAFAAGPESSYVMRDNARVLMSMIVSRWPVRVEGTNFTIAQMAPGAYRVCASGRCASGYLSAGGELALDLR